MVIIRNSINESESLKKDCVAEAKGRVTMIMTQKEMLFIVQSQLAIDLNCSIDDLNGEKDSIIFIEAKDILDADLFQGRHVISKSFQWENQW